MSGLEAAGVVVCSYCGAAFASTPGWDTGWLLAPRIEPGDAVAPAKRWLRKTGCRVRRIHAPRGLLLPIYWARGRYLTWELAEWPGSRALPGSPALLGSFPDPEVNDRWEARFGIQVVAHTFPAHPLSSLLPGRHTRMESATLRVLDPDHLPAGFAWVPPSVTPEQGEAMRNAWLARRAGKFRGPAARVSCGSRFQLVVFPVVVIPFLDVAATERAMVVDALSGQPVGEVPEASRDILSRLDSSRTVPRRRWRPPHLIPLECGNCGVALTIAEQERLTGCTQCGGAWEITEGIRRPVRQWTLEGGSADHRLPFWYFGEEPGPEGPAADTVLVPAYAARHPEAQLHLAAGLTRRPPPGVWFRLAFEILGGASVGSAEARGWEWAVRGALSRSSLKAFLEFVRAAPTPEAATPLGLVWIPFREAGGDLVEPRTGARTRAEGTRPWTPLQSAA